MPALLALARVVIGRAVGGVGRRAVLGGGVGTLGALGAGELFEGGIPGFGFGGGERRRRRRPALTLKDMNQALIIANSISKKAAENFILSRTRGS